MTAPLPDAELRWRSATGSGDDGHEAVIAYRDRLGAVLVDSGVLTESDLEDALEAQRAVTGRRRRLGHVLVDQGTASEEEIALALAEQLALELVDLDRVPLAPEFVRLLPRAVAERLGVLVISQEGPVVTVATSDPTDVVGLDDVRLHTRAARVTVKVATESQVREHLTRAWSLTEAAADGAFVEDPADEPADDGAVDDAPTVRLVSHLLADAVRAGASDVHLEPQRSALRIRFRVDGILRDVMALPRSAMAAAVSRVKIVSGLDIAERRLPQDGRTRFVVDGRQVDARVSTMPALHGEKVVVRLLTRGDQVPSFDDLGLTDGQRQSVRAAVAAAQGLVLITGPTGAGKTSTLYSALAEVDVTRRNVVTLEDPVEVQFPGITQTQVNERAGLTFGRGLRAMLRQDPDVVLVGEVRDPETADLAVRAALTGHLVLTTLHTNGTLEAVTRLVDMGIEHFMLASSLSLVVAQRLVRRPCARCLEPDAPDPDVLELLQVSPERLAGATPVRGAGCTACGQTGYRGRLGVYEVLAVDGRLRKVLGTAPSEDALAAAAGDMVTLREAAVRRALAGETTFEEAARVIPRG